nr:hypothetical protein [Clostridia bacterium]
RMYKALYVIDLKIADTIKKSNSLKYSELREKIIELNNDKREIYKNNEEVINKVLNNYLSDVAK